MFRSATFKLTLIYLAIIMVICFIFSGALYSVLTSELTRNWELPSTGVLEDRPRLQQLFVDPDIAAYRASQLSLGKRHIFFELLYLDVIFLVSGGIVSYVLARRTLVPIEAAHEAQSRFSADASHELRTPLAAMQTEIEVALRDPSLKLKEAKELLGSNLEEIATLQQLIGGLLTLARGENDRLQLKKVSLKKAGVTAIQRVAKRAQLKNITISQDFNPGSTLGDNDGLVELIVILLDNAIKYSETESTVVLQLYADGNHAYIVVEDQGIGIKKDELPHIFDRFYRADRARTHSKTSGHGLGLAIAHQIVTLHHGSINVDQNYSKGTRMIVTLPTA